MPDNIGNDMAALTDAINNLKAAREEAKRCQEVRDNLMKKLRRHYGCDIRAIRAVEGVDLNRQTIYKILGE